jgi:hypothetical protein
MNSPPQDRSRLLASPSLTCASDAISFRTCAIAESTSIRGHKGTQPFCSSKPDLSCETDFKETGGHPILSRPQFQQSRHSYFPGGAVCRPPTHHEAAARPEAWTAAAGRFAGLCNRCSRRAAGSRRTFPYSSGASCPVSKRLSHPVLRGLPDHCRQRLLIWLWDDSWRRELGAELKRYLCSYCTSRLGVLCSLNKRCRVCSRVALQDTRQHVRIGPG